MFSSFLFEVLELIGSFFVGGGVDFEDGGGGDEFVTSLEFTRFPMEAGGGSGLEPEDPRA